MQRAIVGMTGLLCLCSAVFADAPQTTPPRSSNPNTGSEVKKAAPADRDVTQDGMIQDEDGGIAGGAGELCTSAVPIACGGSSTVDLRTFNQTGDTGHPCHNGGAGGGTNTAWWSFVPPAGTTTVRIYNCDHVGLPADTAISIWSGTCAALTNVGCSDDSCGTGDGYMSEVCVAGLVPGQTYFINMSAWQISDAGIYTIRVECPCALFLQGACCAIDGSSCADGVTGVACAQAGNIFQGAGTTCASVTCPVFCDPTKIPEGEPFCSDPDVTNSGCNDLSLLAFSPINCGDRICGDYFANGALRDTDWYEVNLSDPATYLTWTLLGTHGMLGFIIAPGPDPLDPCTGNAILVSDAQPAGTPVTISACVGPGITWLWAGNPSFSGVPCVGRYNAELLCDVCPIGACCLTSTCQDGLDAAGCAAAGGIYQGDGALCANVDCVGACCLADGSCSNLNEPACTAANGVFNGQGTRCGDAFIFCNGACCACPAACTVTSQQNCQAAGGFFQGNGSTCVDVNNCAATSIVETVCTPGTDNFNGGCNSTPNIFSAITCGQTICAGSANPSGAGPRDTDWYRFDLTQTSRVKWRVVGTSAMQANILSMSAGGACPVVGNLIAEISSGAFVSVEIEITLPPGNYVAFAGVPLTAPPGVPCQNTYRGELLCCPLPNDCTGGTLEGEANCGGAGGGGGSDTTNGGCNITPALFTTIGCDQKICGTTAIDTTLRDTDWYSYTNPGSAPFDVCFSATSSKIVTLIRAPAACPIPDGAFGVSFLFDPCDPDCITITPAGPGEQWIIIVVNPFNTAGEGEYAAVPCGSDEGEYSLEVNGTCAPPCVCGDSNCDGVVNILDINFFVAAVQGQAAWTALHGGSPTCSYCCSNDTNGDGVVNILDINSFVAAVSSGGCTNSTMCP
ncbi:hypothetical protein RAS1_10700 [Phycisphaerae bacterium RAS1]|nr:hypothetical protein RAS1_10700 [Phycisphaerae bacterium RAS1]